MKLTLVQKTIASLVLAVALFASTNAHAERSTGGKGKWSTIVYGGFTFPDPYFVNGSGRSFGYTGVSFGLGFETKILPMIAIKIDMLYANKGYEVISDVHTRYPNAYVTFPVQLSFQPTPYFAVHGGPYLSSLVVSASSEAGGVEASQKSRFANDYGITLGFWLGFKANNALMIGIDTRYDIGLADIEHDAYPEDKLYMRTISSMMTFNFTF